ncbi:hypothetical protein K435DRAFT_844864 [Dendrothele bispora CBS 962.96]|uniref:Uncharacterized protein n=1 Tax=Dendrothele bispora (strain CBS 962.96) TaxID=1314807 RepID=A0A4S8KYG6_DENBC|nr:hypothetical protein K435DRAFT_844864 [Dendrothele bispora CBS 962.96]
MTPLFPVLLSSPPSSLHQFYPVLLRQSYVLMYLPYLQSHISHIVHGSSIVHRSIGYRHRAIVEGAGVDPTWGFPGEETGPVEKGTVCSSAAAVVLVSCYGLQRRRKGDKEKRVDDTGLWLEFEVVDFSSPSMMSTPESLEKERKA